MNAVILNDLASSWRRNDTPQFLKSLSERIFPSGRVPLRSAPAETKAQKRLHKIASQLNRVVELAEDIDAFATKLWKELTAILWPSKPKMVTSGGSLFVATKGESTRINTSQAAGSTSRRISVPQVKPVLRRAPPAGVQTAELKRQARNEREAALRREKLHKFYENKWGEDAQTSSHSKGRAHAQNAIHSPRQGAAVPVSSRTLEEERACGFSRATGLLTALVKEEIGLKPVAPRKRKTRNAVVRTGDVGWWALAYQPESIVTPDLVLAALSPRVGLTNVAFLFEYGASLIEHYSRAETEEAEALAADPLENLLRQREAEQAVIRALTPIDPKANAPKSTSAKPRVTKLSGLEASKLQNSLAEIRDQQRTTPDTPAPEKPSSKTVQSQAEFIAELNAGGSVPLAAPEPETLVDMVSAVPTGLTHKQKAQAVLEQLWQPKAKRHSAGPVFHESKPERPQPKFVIRWDRLARCVYIENVRKNLAAIRCQSAVPELAALYAYHEDEAHKALARIGRNKSMDKVRQSEDHLIEMMAVNELAAQHTAMLVMEVPLVNPFVTLANLFGRYTAIPRVSQRRANPGRVLPIQQEAT